MWILMYVYVCLYVCLDQILQKVEHVTVDKCMRQFDYTGPHTHTYKTNNLHDNNHSRYLFVFFKTSCFYKFCKTSFLFLYVIFIMKINSFVF